MNELTEIQDWYLSECDGDWEHQFGIKIGTLDNPGWSLDIDLEETELQEKPFIPNEKGVGPGVSNENPDWYACKVKDKKFVGRCGPSHLRTILRIFLDWKNG